MARDEDGFDTLGEESPEKETVSDRSNCTNRRNVLKLAGVGAATLTGLSFNTAQAATVSEGGPASPSDWKLSFEDTFESGSLDPAKWSVGFGWGLETGNSPERIVDENVFVEDQKLHLTGTHDGSDYKAGAVNTKNKAYFGPGSYWEAKIKLPKRVGFLPAFWAKSNNAYEVPPEVDFVELFQTDGDSSDTHVSHHNVHYTASTEVGDDETQKGVDVSYDAGVDLTSDFHIYGCEWQQDRLVSYVDGKKIAEHSDDTIIKSLENGAPFYLMLSLHIDRLGSVDSSESWGEAIVADWVRVWEYSPDESSETTSEQSDENTGSNDTDHYIWLSSADGDPVTYAFEASGGNIRSGSNVNEPQDEWISDDGTTAGGTVSETGSSGDGFHFQGEITDFSYSGSLITYIDSESVDPDTLVDSSKPGPTESSQLENSLSNTIVIDGSPAPRQVANYEVTVSGNLEKSGDLGSIQSNDNVSGATANGDVYGGKDGYRFSGELTELRVDGSVTVSLTDGDQSSSSGESLPNSFVVDGTGTPYRKATYSITVDGSVEKSSELGSIQQNDTISESTASGQVYGGKDGYVYSGEVTEMDIDGPVVVRFEDTDG